MRKIIDFNIENRQKSWISMKKLKKSNFIGCDRDFFKFFWKKFTLLGSHTTDFYVTVQNSNSYKIPLTTTYKLIEANVS
jgi:hypothetical protein